MVVFALVLLFLGPVFSVRFLGDDKLVRQLQVQTCNGMVQGRTRSVNGTLFYSFQGIPYARPPVGALRFRAPKPAGNWFGVLDATKEAPYCIELRIRRNKIQTTGVEDCLYLNIYTPDLPVYRRNLPVLVYIYGGAFIEGNSRLSHYGPRFFLQQNIMVVTFNYRLGAFGFLSSETPELPGNMGLKDQNLVLQWVQQNIRNFGGDPNNVAIFGQSAGSSSVFYHIQSPKSGKFFHKAIAHSGSSLSGYALQLKPRELFYQMAEMLDLGSENATHILNQLTLMDVEELKQAQRNVALLNFLEYRKYGLPFSPTLEPPHSEAFITQPPYQALANGNFTKIPLLVGITSLESIVFKYLFQILQPILELLYDNSPGMLAMPNLNSKSATKNRQFGLELVRKYFNSKAFTGATMEEIYNMFSDDSYLRPTHKSVQLMSKFIPVFFFVFSYEGKYLHDGTDLFRQREPGEKGAAHGDELYYLWDTEAKLRTKKDILLAQRITKMWTNFIKFGNPTPTLDPILNNVQWPPATPDRSMLHLDINDNLTVTEQFRNEYVEFWDYLYRKYGHEPYNTY